jgi:hypothetical protein
MLLLVGCTTLAPWDTGSDDSEPPAQRIVVSPGALDFGDISINTGGITVRTLTIYNLGDTTETITGHDEPIGSDAFVIDAPPLLELEPGEQIDLDVHYLPGTEQVDGAELLVDPTNETVRLSGVGRAPVLGVGAAAIDPVVVGCTGTGTLALRNDGSEPLSLAGVTSASAEFAVASFPDALAAGESGALTFTFAPGGGGARGTSFVVTSNDPAFPAVGTTVSGLAYEGEAVTETFRYFPTNPTDILFAVATDDTMAGYGDRARGAFAAFVDTLRDGNVDYHLAAVTSAGPCPTATPGWADRTDTSLQAEVLLQRAFDQGDGAWGGDLVALAGAALDAVESGECLVDFRRETADLAVILVTAGPSDGDPRGSALDLDLRVLAPASLSFSGLLPLDPECGAEASDYAGVIESWAGRAEDLCEEDWAPGLTALAALPASDTPVEFVLAEVPVASTISVLAEAVTFDAWTWDAEKNAIRFDTEDTPALGAELTVRYVSSVACE